MLGKSFTELSLLQIKTTDFPQGCTSQVYMKNSTIFSRRTAMKLKNHYAWLFVVCAIATLANSLSCVVNFVGGNIIIGFIFFVLSIAFGFVSGMLLQKSLEIREHNKTCDWLKEIAEDLKEQYFDSLSPFEEFDKK
jgi:hypothetical protein